MSEGSPDVLHAQRSTHLREDDQRHVAPEVVPPHLEVVARVALRPADVDQRLGATEHVSAVVSFSSEWFHTSLQLQ